MATIFMSVYGKEGICELALQNLAKAQYAAQQLSSSAGATLKFTGTPRFHEFVIESTEPADAMNARLLEQKIIGGLPLAKWYPELGNASLWCATELNTREEIDRAAAALGTKAGRTAQGGNKNERRDEQKVLTHA
jgi:glycine cleavage system P protein (glycine dehydrogenase) subunit 1